MSTYALTATGVTRLEDGANIPNDPANADWVVYQAWQTGGGVPRPLQPDWTYDWNGSAWVVNAARATVAAAATSLGVDLAAVRANGPVVTFMNMTPQQVADDINGITGTTAAIIAAMKVRMIVLGQVLVVIARDRIANP